MIEKQNGLIVVLAGPSGAGKSVILKLLGKLLHDAVFSVSVTTRLPREDEVDGINYYFWHPEQFVDAREAGEFIESARVGDRFYGTPEAFVKESLVNGKIVLMDLDCSGVSQIRASCKERNWKLLDIFILPPSMQILEERLRKRGEKEIEQRLARAEGEVAQQCDFTLVITNRDIGVCVEEIISVIEGFR